MRYDAATNNRRKNNTMTTDVSARPGRFGQYGGAYIPETLAPAVAALTEAYQSAQADPSFWNEFDMLLRPILWRQLRVGARIVSHRFTMGDWMPDRTVTAARPTDDEVAMVHLWTITKEVKARAAK